MSPNSLKILILLFFNIDFLRTEKCLQSDMILKYTECDKAGQRWLVSVPNTNKTCDKDSEFIIPKKARDCGNPCDPGTYLEMKSQECKDCQPGTYSQSATTEMDHWEKMPPDFHSYSVGNYDNNCTTEKWTANGEYLAASVSKCESHLYYTASLFKAGELVFEYQNPEEDLIFAIKISNDNCQSTSEIKENVDIVKYFDSTGPSDWNKIKIHLKKGNNIIRWVVVGLETHVSTVKIKYLKISNTLYSSQCIQCNPGYFSSGKSSKCTPCAMNTYSDQPGSSQCSSCHPDKYSFPGSKNCTDKPFCRRDDYSYKWTTCNQQNKRQKKFYWIEPKLCSETKPESVKLPENQNLQDCSLCPAGTFLNKISNKCEYCPAGTASMKPGDDCTKCGPNTKPVTEIIYDQWARPLPNVSFRCLKIDNDCNNNETWIYNGDHLQSSPAFDINLLEIDFDIIKESNATKKMHSSEFSFDFSMKCSGYCAMYLYLKRSKGNSRIMRWINSTDRHTFSYNNFREAGQLIWVFSRSRDYTTSEKTNDYVKIYSVKMSKLKNVGAVRCQYCNPNSPSTECADCGKGKYFSPNSQTCVQCDQGFVLEANGRTVKDCKKCGEGLIAVNGTMCLPSSHYHSLYDNHYDLSPLKGSHVVQGNSLFTTHGLQYKHLFSVTLFSDNGTFSVCKNNVTTSEEDVYDYSSPMCRSTLILSKKENGAIFAMQSISLADKFTQVKQSNSSLEYWRKMNESLILKGFPGDENGMDIHFHMISERKTENCKSGYGTIITMRCDLSTIEPKLLLPPHCTMETCDGCNFHFLLLSKHSCPECRPEDYTTLTEECLNGAQKRHFQSPSYCLKPKKFSSTVEIRCPLFTTKMEIGVITTTAVLFFLVGLVIYCYKKNKKLEYKYMRLIGGNDDNENVLNGAESCGMHDGEDEEDDDVKIKTNSKSGKIFAKFNKPSQYRNDKGSMERINLNENTNFDI